MDATVQLCLETISGNKQAIVFCNSKRSAEKLSEDIAKHVALTDHDLSNQILRALSQPTTQCERLSRVAAHKIVFHHSGLASKQRSLIEDEFRNGRINVICATPTLAAGLSLPVFRVIIKTLKRFSGGWGMKWIPVLEYLQMAGRAGRPEYEDYGEAIIIAKNDSERDEVYERYICGKPESIFSKLAAQPILRNHVLSLVSSGIIRDTKSAETFFSNTFWAQQYDDLQELYRLVFSVIYELRQWGFIEQQPDFVSGNNQEIKITRLGQRVSQMYLDPLTAHRFIESFKQFEQPNNYCLLQMVCYSQEMYPGLRVKTGDKDLVDTIIVTEDLAFNIDVYDNGYDEYVNSIKTAKCLDEWTCEISEQEILRVYDCRPGELKVKRDVAEWLLRAASEIAGIVGYEDLCSQLYKLHKRVQYGVKEECLKLLQIKGIGRVRARRLINAGVRSVKDYRLLSPENLKRILRGGKLRRSEQTTLI